MSGVCRLLFRNTAAVAAVCLVVMSLAMPAVASAQSTSEKRWGVNLSFTPAWTENEKLKDRLFWGDEDFPLEGSELLIGFVKGTMRGGDWGVSYVRKPIKNTTVSVSQTQQFCSGPNNASCQTQVFSSTTESRDVLVDGVEVHFFIPVVTLANRVQLGVNAGGGAGFPTGTVARFGTSTNTFTQPGLPPQVTTQTFSSEGDAADEIISKVVPLLKVEFQAAVIVAPGLKIKFAAGLNAPSAPALRIGMTYLFGAR